MSSVGIALVPLCAFATCLVVSLIIAVPLHTAGYNRHLGKNDRLIDTRCTVVEHAIVSATCYRSCNCYQQCSQRCTTSTDSQGRVTTTCTPSCHQVCSSCPYECYTAAWVVTYRAPADSEEKRTASLPTAGARYTYRSQAEQALRSRPVDSTFVAYVDPEKPDEVLLEKHSVGGFLAAAIVFYVLAGVALIGMIVTAVAAVVIQCC